MSAAIELVLAARSAGLVLSVKPDGRLGIRGKVAPAWLPRLAENKAQILTELRREASEPPPDAPAWWPLPHPRITEGPPFGAAEPARLWRQAWERLLCGPPEGVPLRVWECAVFDAVQAIGDYGAELDRLGWSGEDFVRLTWFQCGSPVMCIGRDMAMLRDGRIFRT